MRPLRFIAVAALSLLAFPALADNRRAAAAGSPARNGAAMCRSSCMSVAAERAGGGGAMAERACAIRCTAGMSYLAQQNRGGTAAATGRGSVARPLQATQPRLVPPIRNAVLSVAAAAPRGLVVVYAARSPSAGFGMAVGATDRMVAHQRAQASCSTGGTECRPVAELAGACGATAQAVTRSQWALFITADPNSYVVSSVSAGSGATQALAEQGAMADCRARDLRSVCRIAASACDSRG